MGSVLDLEGSYEEKKTISDLPEKTKINAFYSFHDVCRAGEAGKQQIKTIRLILRIEASSNNHPAEVPEAVFPTHNEERFVKIWMIFSQLLFLDFPA